MQPATRVSALDALRSILDDHIALAEAVRADLLGEVADLADDLDAALRRGGKLLTFGNGGSAADAQHFAAELVGRFRRPRAGLAAVALTTDTSALTAIANDFDYAEVFARQVAALGRPGDVAVGLSTSGDAENVVRGLAAAADLGARTWALTGAAGGRCAGVAGRTLRVPSRETARVQEMHITIVHAIAELVDARAASAEG